MEFELLRIISKTTKFQTKPNEIMDCSAAPEGPRLPPNERHSWFIIYSLEPDKKDEPFRPASKEALENNVTVVDIHHYFLTIMNRLKLQAMPKCDLSGLENYYVFAQCEAGMEHKNIQEDVDKLNNIYRASLCE